MTVLLSTATLYLALGAIVNPPGVGEFRPLREDSRGFTVERRHVEGSTFFEYRVKAIVRATPTTLSESVWTRRPTASEAKMVSRTAILSESVNTRMIWLLVSPPLVSPRTMLVRFDRSTDANGEVRISMNLVAGAEPEQIPGALPMRSYRGNWSFKPLGGGETEVEFLSYSDPGGNVPGWMAAPAQAEDAAEKMRALLENMNRLIVKRD